MNFGSMTGMASFSLAPLSRVTFSSLIIFSFTLSRSKFTVAYLLSLRQALAGVKRAALLLRFRQKSSGIGSTPGRSTLLTLVFQNAAGSSLNRGGMHVRKPRFS